ncbi:MAG: ABC-2 family transporter protein [Leptospiraceae bacterium]|nr:ABC-2 family transporter protein [Leptospiraceae bacterium]MCP5510754.1 ABC-2 family transporter protein [Leptospiraceae bacterium]
MVVYLRLATASVKSRMEYRASFAILIFTLISFYTAQILTIGIVIYRFKKIGGWNIGEMAFLYSLMVLSQGLVSSVFSGLVDFGSQVRDGSFDRTMIRPLSPIGQVIMNGFEIAGIAHIFLGIASFIFANSLLNINWTFSNIIAFLFVVLGGSGILAGIRIGIAAVAFWAVNNSSLVHLFVYSSREFLLYPLNIYSTGVRFLLTFIVPLGFINFYPAHFFLGKSPENVFHPYFIYGTLPVGIFTYFVSLWFWKLGQNAYESAGG